MPGEIPPAQDREWVLVAELERAEGAGPADAAPRCVYRSRDGRRLILAEHAGFAGVRIGPEVPHDLPRDIAADILMLPRVDGDQVDLMILAVGLIEALAKRDQALAKLVAMEARAVRAEAEARDVRSLDRAPSQQVLL